MRAGGDRICSLCYHVHAYDTPIYRCDVCKVWVQDYYETTPYTPTRRERLRNLRRLAHAALKRGLRKIRPSADPA